MVRPAAVRGDVTALPQQGHGDLDREREYREVGMCHREWNTWQVPTPTGLAPDPRASLLPRWDDSRSAFFPPKGLTCKMELEL